MHQNILSDYENIYLLHNDCVCILSSYLLFWTEHTYLLHCRYLELAMNDPVEAISYLRVNSDFIRYFKSLYMPVE